MSHNSLTSLILTSVVCQLSEKSQRSGKVESVLVVVWSSGVGALALSHRDGFGNQVLSS